MAQTARNTVKSVERTFRIIGGLQELGGAGVTELSTHLDLPKSTVHNYLSTLEQEAYVVKADDEYRIGLRFLEHGAYARNQSQIFEIARPELDRLANETGELCNLLVEEHGKGTYLYRTRGENAVRVKEHVGNRVCLHSTALGKAILAHCSEERVDEIIDRHGLPETTDRTVTDRDELFDTLAEIRERGVAFDDEERLSGLRCVAAPVLSNDDRVLGAISVSGPSHRFEDHRFREELPKRVLETANVLELNVTYS
ncbi:IclR family transcriptional regulator [Halosimplex pelagicum]|jgi:DNA-binding IclR family transcriptional regulator|uniref:IclR family transcriptional regulator n=1 Tax=Halosimplex pelagicum TaxID=869886 RepID=A0A7D5P8V3_9EURY|nr:IclR family transcriptional regulator [Halosimplex pelagicum]QLH83686.1 IclR family transcriptional regulator [Halosimplex pelagicum]